MTLIPQLQTNNKTYWGRYLIEHQVLSRYVDCGKPLSILSFGCSTGEELLLIHKLLPNASLYGCDVDWHNLQTARALLGERATVFHSTSDNVQRNGPYDVILCNSVLLRHTEAGSDGKKSGIDREIWNSVLLLLDASLRDGGILQIINSNIPFRFHTVYQHYKPLRASILIGSNFVDQFDYDGRHLCTGVGGLGWSSHLYRHLGEKHWQDLVPTDLTDIHFLKDSSGYQSPPPAVNQDISVSTAQPHHLTARGSSLYSTEQDLSDSRPSTKTEVVLTWSSYGADFVSIEREIKFYWFDGTLVESSAFKQQLTGAAAGNFLESCTGRPSSRLFLDKLVQPVPIHSPHLF